MSGHSLFSGIPSEFMQAIVHQMSHQAAAMAPAVSAGPPAQVESVASSASNMEGAASTQHPQPAGTRVVINRPSFSPHIPQPVGPRGTTIRLRATVPAAGQQLEQVTPAQREKGQHYHFILVFLMNVRNHFKKTLK